jgi:hypothetical protein
LLLSESSRGGRTRLRACHVGRAVFQYQGTHAVSGVYQFLYLSDCIIEQCLSAVAAPNADLSSSMSALSLSSAPAVYFVNDHTKIVFSGPTAAIDLEQHAELNEDNAFDDIGGLKAQIESVREMVELPLKRHTNLFNFFLPICFLHCLFTAVRNYSLNSV